MPKEDEPGVLWCCQCGASYLENDTASEEQIRSVFGPGLQQTKIITPKKKKKYYDQSGHEITDPTLINDIMQGKTVIKYHEEKSGKERHVVKK